MLGIRDFTALDRRIKQARTPGGDESPLSSAEAVAIVDHSIVQHSLLRLFIRVCQFEHEQGFAELFGTKFQPFHWEDGDGC